MSGDGDASKKNKGSSHLLTSRIPASTLKSVTDSETSSPLILGARQIIADFLIHNFDGWKSVCLGCAKRILEFGGATLNIIKRDKLIADASIFAFGKLWMNLLH